MKRLEKLGNYLVITDTESGVIEIDRPTKDLQGKIENGRVQFYSNNQNEQNPLKGHQLYLFGGVAANGSVTINTTSATKASGTVTCATAVIGNTVTVNGLLYTAVAGVKTDNTKFSIDTSNTATATDLAASINNDVRVGTLNDLTASAALAVVTIVQTVGGLSGNATTLASSGATLAVSGATFTGGLDDTSVSGITVNAVQIMSGAEFSGDDKDALALLVASNINAYTSTPNYTAVAAGALITITAVELGGGENGLAVASTVVKATKTDVNMAGGATNLVKTGDAFFNNLAELVTFVRANTGA